MAFDDALNLFNFKNTPIYNYITAYPIVSKISMRSIISRSSISIGITPQRRDVPHCWSLCFLKYRSFTSVLYRLFRFSSVDIFSLATLIAPFHKMVIMIFPAIWQLYELFGFTYSYLLYQIKFNVLKIFINI